MGFFKYKQKIAKGAPEVILKEYFNFRKWKRNYSTNVEDLLNLLILFFYSNPAEEKKNQNP